MSFRSDDENPSALIQNKKYEKLNSVFSSILSVENQAEEEVILLFVAC